MKYEEFRMKNVGTAALNEGAADFYCDIAAENIHCAMRL